MKIYRLFRTRKKYYNHINRGNEIRKGGIDMQVVLNEKLKEHMQANGQKDVVLYAAMCNT